MSNHRYFRSICRVKISSKYSKTFWGLCWGRGIVTRPPSNDKVLRNIRHRDTRKSVFGSEQWLRFHIWFIITLSYKLQQTFYYKRLQVYYKMCPVTLLSVLLQNETVLLQNATVLLQNGTVLSQSGRVLLLNEAILLQNKTVLLQNATAITKCHYSVTKHGTYYKIWRLFWNVSVHTVIISR